MTLKTMPLGVPDAGGDGAGVVGAVAPVDRGGVVGAGGAGGAGVHEGGDQDIAAVVALEGDALLAP